MPLETALHDVCKEPPRPDDRGRSMNRHIRMCPDCGGTGFVEDGPDPRGRIGWCAECRGLGWYAAITAGDVVRGALLGAGTIAVMLGLMAIAP